MELRCRLIRTLAVPETQSVGERCSWLAHGGLKYYFGEKLASRLQLRALPDKIADPHIGSGVSGYGSRERTFLSSFRLLHNDMLTSRLTSDKPHLLNPVSSPPSQTQSCGV